jgi:hypothetical protein
VIGEAELLCVAATASGIELDELLAGTDVAALARVVARTEPPTGAFEDAARLLLAVLQERPFPDDTNAATGWLAAALVLDGAGARVRGSRADIVAFVRSIDEQAELLDVVVGIERLAVASDGRRSSVRCPKCSRELYARERREGRAVIVGVSAFELTNRCWYEHRAHDRRGEPFPVVETVGVGVGAP